jgi:hypothetical protein
MSSGPAPALQFHELPLEAKDALIARLADLAGCSLGRGTGGPAGAGSCVPEYRSTEFGEAGLVLFHVRENEQTVAVYDLLWAG